LARTGIGSIEPAAGLKALDKLMAAPLHQLAFVTTTKPWNSTDENIRAYGASAPSVMEAIVRSWPTSRPETREAGWHERLTADLTELAAGVIGVPTTAIDGTEDWRDQGVDALHLSAFAEKINERYGFAVTGRQVLEQGSLRRLADHLRLIHADTPSTPPAAVEENAALDSVLAPLLAAQLRAMGGLAGLGATADGMAATLGLDPRYRRWLDESLRVLVEHGYAKQRNGLVTATQAVDLGTAWAAWDDARALWQADVARKAAVRLLDAVMRALPDILRGTVPATDVIFPEASMALVEGVYRNNPTADFFNGIVAETAAAFVAARRQADPATRLRILEIGAGTGGTSAMVLERLKPLGEAVAEYCYTDLSKAFLLHAEQVYGPRHPNLRLRPFDVEKPPAAQGFDAGGYDLVIATNVLHATRDIRRTLRNAKAVLRKNGVILLNELSRNSLFAHLTFGLLEGWWLHKDPALRIPGSPILSQDAWQAVLADEGFGSVCFPAEAAHRRGQQVILGESDGVVRQQTFRQVVADVQPVQPRAAVSHPVPVPKKAASYRDLGDDMVETRVRGLIQESVARALMMNRGSVDYDRPFSEYGVDSIISVQLVNLINNSLGIKLSTIALFDYNTIDQLTKHVVAEHRDTVVQALSINAPEVSDAPGPEVVSGASIDRHSYLRGRTRSQQPP
ncbi:MAG TPA: phosphopantetheine-binding protein, partial [Bradyrhizobium sp.]|nr:phosphopantetheine-binding protein [Bradyrhizobium sp.]